MRLHDEGGIFDLYDMLTIWNASDQANGIYIALMKAGGITEAEYISIIPDIFSVKKNIINLD